MDKVSEEIRQLKDRTADLELLCARLSERLRMVGAALAGSEGAEVPKRAGANGSVALQKSPAGRGPGGTAVRSDGRQMPKKVSAAASADVAVVRQPTKVRPDTEKPRPKKPKLLQQNWFKKGEAVELFRRILKQPMRSRQLMAGVIRAKRKSELPKPELERFRWAVQAALKQAVKGGSIVRQTDGLLAATAVGVPGESASTAAGKR